MKKAMAAITMLAVLSLLSCTKKETIKHFEFNQAGLSVKADLSPSRGDETVINGRMTVSNTSSGFLKYGNSQLFLVAEDQKSVTRVNSGKSGTADSNAVSPMADTRQIDLAPGDSIHFTAYWQFGNRVDFGRTFFVFQFIDTVQKMPASADTTRQDSTAPATVDTGKKAS
jgi:hypothetical protein